MLGTSDYKECDYRKDGVSYGSVRFVQEATVNYLNCKNEWTSSDHIYVLLTEEAEQKNWNDNAVPGLKAAFDKMSLPCPVTPVTGLPVGNNEDEIWTLFEKAFALIEEGDELYFDITHGLRYMPMLILVLCDYVGFLKNTVLRSVTYGNYEVSKSKGHGLIIDLSPLSDLQRWTYAAGQYIDNGNVEKMVGLGKDHVLPIIKHIKDTGGEAQEEIRIRQMLEQLNKVVAERQTCRGMDIMKSASLKKLATSMDEVKHTGIKPLDPILDRIKESYSLFNTECDPDNMYQTARWCLDNKQYQQCITFLQEYVVTYICLRNGLQTDLIKEREVVNKAMNIKSNPKVTLENCIIDDSLRPKLVKTLDDPLLKDQKLPVLFDQLSSIRNDFNHCGMRKGSTSYSGITDKIEQLLEQTKGILDNSGTTKEWDDVRTPTLVNLSNHPSRDWSERQLSVAREQFGEITDMPYPDVNPEGDEEYIDGLATEYTDKVLQLAATRSVTVHLMGEMTLLYNLAGRLINNGIECVASTTNRNVHEQADGSREVRFDFVGFRKYR